MKKIIKLLFYGLLTLLAVLLYKTLTTTSRQISVDKVAEVNVDKNAIQRLAASVKIPTVSYPDRIDTAAFVQHNEFLDTTFRRIRYLARKNYGQSI